MSDFRDFAVDLSKQADAIAKRYFHTAFEIVRKADNSPVTIADTSINDLVIDAVRSAYPEHRVIGEEASLDKEDAEYSWVCDPIDGTIPFSTGVPTFAFSLALVQNGIPILGVISASMQDQLFVAEIDQGATCNGETVRVNSEIEYKSGTIFIESINAEPRCRKLRSDLDDSYLCTLRLHSMVFSGTRVISGSAAALVGGSSHPWDSAALAIIGREAGAVVTDLVGKTDMRYDGKVNGLVLAANQTISDQLIELMNN